MIQEESQNESLEKSKTKQKTGFFSERTERNDSDKIIMNSTDKNNKKNHFIFLESRKIKNTKSLPLIINGDFECIEDRSYTKIRKKHRLKSLDLNEELISEKKEIRKIFKKIIKLKMELQSIPKSSKNQEKNLNNLFSKQIKEMTRQNDQEKIIIHEKINLNLVEEEENNQHKQMLSDDFNNRNFEENFLMEFNEETKTVEYSSNVNSHPSISPKNFAGFEKYLSYSLQNEKNPKEVRDVGIDTSDLDASTHSLPPIEQKKTVSKTNPVVLSDILLKQVFLA